MAQRRTGKSFREGITLVEIFRMAEHEAAERWFVEARWPDGFGARIAAR